LEQDRTVGAEEAAVSAIGDLPDSAPEGFRSGVIALVGQPNVGKSTLLNALVGEKVAIVSPKPQTTRRQVLGIATTEDAQMVFVDTPGLHTPEHDLGRYMVKVAQAAVPAADLAVWVVDVSRTPDDADRRIARTLHQAGRPLILAMNKTDRLPPERIRELTEAWLALAEPAEWVMTIANKGHNLELLRSAMLDRLPEGPLLYPDDQLSDQSPRMLACELVREAALYHLQQEIPHGIEVIIEDWIEREDGLINVAAKIFVERSGHKAIVIGKGGIMLKRIGTSARREMERLLEQRIFLELFVSVRPGWRRDPSDLRRLGFD
jgi:GTP-binding protein Era